MCVRQLFRTVDIEVYIGIRLVKHNGGDVLGLGSVVIEIGLNDIIGKLTRRTEMRTEGC